MCVDGGALDASCAATWTQRRSDQQAQTNATKGSIHKKKKKGANSQPATKAAGDTCSFASLVSPCDSEACDYALRAACPCDCEGFDYDSQAACSKDGLNGRGITQETSSTAELATFAACVRRVLPSPLLVRENREKEKRQRGRKRGGEEVSALHLVVLCCACSVLTWWACMRDAGGPFILSRLPSTAPAGNSAASA